MIMHVDSAIIVPLVWMEVELASKESFCEER